MQQIFENSEIKFHTAENKFEETILSGFPNDILFSTEHFGVFKFKLVSKSSTNIPKTYAILLNVDCSASMSDLSKDGRTKMQHVTHILKRILSSFAEMHKLHGTNILVSVIAFDDKIHEIFSFTKITEDIVESLKNMVNDIEPLESTNIELALNKATQICDEYKKENPTHYLHHIFLTDGYATVGESNQEVLSKLVNQNYPNVFIGFGKQHNALLLSCLSNDVRNDYRFIDNIEHSGIVYGEIIQNILYSIIDIGCISVKNGLIYDWKLNQWVTDISIANLAGSCERTFQIKAEDMYEIEIDFYGTLFDGNTLPEEKLLDSVVYYPPLIDLNEDENQDITVDLTPYAFRQKTQELLHEASILSKNDVSKDSLQYEKETTLKDNLKQFLKFMMNYVEKTDKKTDKFMKLLCDDIYVTLNTLGNQESSMWILNRESSQGKQQTYKATPSRRDLSVPPILRRQTNNHYMTQTTNIYEASDTPVLRREITRHASDAEFTFDTRTDPFSGDFNENFRGVQNNSLHHLIEEEEAEEEVEEEVEEEEYINSIENYELSNNIDTPYITDEIAYMMKNIGGD